MKKHLCIYILLFIFHFILSTGVLAQPQTEQPLSEAEKQEISSLIEEIDRLTKPSDLPRRIELLTSVLMKVTKEAIPELWAGFEVELGISLSQNPFGDRAENLERAIEHYGLALEVFSREAFPKAWARIQNNLGGAYRNRVYGDPADNLERAIEHYDLSLQVHTKEAFPEDWARTHYNLGNTYSDRVHGDRADNLEQAIEHYQLALQVRTRERFPKEWAATQCNLGIAYTARIRGDRADNLEQAMEHCELSLEVYTRDSFPEHWARAHSNLGTVCTARIRGDRADNLEQAIMHCQMALQVLTQYAFPMDWAVTNNNLGNAYVERINGERADNLDRAIVHYQLSLQVYTKEAFPEDWAGTQYNLGSAYCDRIRGDPADNLEQAIKHSELALEVYTRDPFPEYWAKIQCNLGIAYSGRIHGVRANNLKRAIQYYQLALEIYTRKAFPEDWARIQNNLGFAYWNCIHGDRAGNLERAIGHYQLALKVLTKKAYPEGWAKIHNNLGLAYWNRIREDRADNIERAIQHYELSLQVFTPEGFPEGWARAQNNLGIVYGDRILGDRADNLERSIKHLQSALEVYNRDGFPLYWGGIQNNVGVAYWKRPHGDRADNLERSIEHLLLALHVRTREAYSESWATTQNNLGNSYRDRILGDRADNLEQAIAHYDSVLQVLTRKAFPTDYVKTAVNLAKCHLQRLDWRRVCDICLGAEGVGEELIGLAAGEEVQAKYLSKISSAFVYHTYALARLGQSDSALEVLEKGKTRSLNEALLLQRISSSALALGNQEKLTSLRQGIFSLEQQLKDIGGKEAGQYEALAQERRRLQSELMGFLQTIKKQLPLEAVEDWDIRKALESCQKEGIVTVGINITSVGTLLLVSNPHKDGLTPIFLDGFNTDSLDQITWNPGDQDLTSLSWIQSFPQSEGDWLRWVNEQPKILARLGEWLWPKLDQFLQEQKIDRVLLIPQGDLFLYPLHATPFIPLNSVDHMPIYPLERYTISYAPSLRVYDQLTRTSVVNVENKEALFVEDPDGNLGFSFAGQKFLSDQVEKRKLVPVLLHGSEVRADTVLEHMQAAGMIHYYGHGHYDWVHPRSSGVKMHSPGEVLNLLSMEQISQTLSASRGALVVLSACETGMTDVMHSEWRDQYMGLPAGFLRAGAGTVVGSLWSVPNGETCLLFSRFYQELFSGEGMTPAEALRQAQLWMLRATPEEIEEVAKTYFLGLEPGVSQLELKKTQKYSNHPANWAAFYVVGNGFAVFE